MTKQLTDLEQSLDYFSRLESSRWIPEAGHFHSFQVQIRLPVNIGFKITRRSDDANISPGWHRLQLERWREPVVASKPVKKRKADQGPALTILRGSCKTKTCCAFPTPSCRSTSTRWILSCCQSP